ncbi:MAG: fimbrillin family protein [Marinifilaceae bacterium]
MKHYPNTRYLTIVLFTIFTLGCAGKDYYVDINEMDQVAKDTTRILYSPNFTTVSVSAHNEQTDPSTKGGYTPDTIDFPKGRIIHVYVYKGGDTPQTATPIAFSMLISYANGLVKPMSSQYNLKLAAGVYSLYAMSEYNYLGDQTPPFVNSNGSGGLKYGLSNQCDYLWWKMENIHISQFANPPIPIVFKHICTLIQLNLHATAGNKITQIGSATIETPSPSGCRLQMATGYINPAPTFQTNTTSFTQSGNNFYVNLVPAIVTFRPLVYIDVALNGGYLTWHSIFLPTPSKGLFKQGNGYIYNIYFSGNRSEAPQVELIEISNDNE